MDIFFLASFIGTIAFAFSGFLVGVHKKMDLMGIFILSMLTANGGGALRDILLNKTPSVLTDLSGFYMVLCVFILAFVFRLHRYAIVEKSRLFVLSDALGLAAFSVTGALAAVDASLSIFGVMVLAFITASGGGIIRDLLVNEMPSVLSSDFYGTVSILIGLGIYALHQTGLDNNLNISLLFVAALILRLLAYLRGWKLPRMRQD